MLAKGKFLKKSFLVQEVDVEMFTEDCFMNSTNSMDLPDAEYRKKIHTEKNSDRCQYFPPVLHKDHYEDYTGCYQIFGEKHFSTLLSESSCQA